MDPNLFGRRFRRWKGGALVPVAVLGVGVLVVVAALGLLPLPGRGSDDAPTTVPPAGESIVITEGGQPTELSTSTIVDTSTVPDRTALPEWATCEPDSVMGVRPSAAWAAGLGTDREGAVEQAPEPLEQRIDCLLRSPSGDEIGVGVAGPEWVDLAQLEEQFDLGGRPAARQSTSVAGAEIGEVVAVDLDGLALVVGVRSASATDEVDAAAVATLVLEAAGL